MALKGTLKDFAVSDIFQLADQQQKSGVLKLTNKKSEVRVLFDAGKIVGAESAAGRNREPLGAMLVRSGLVNEDDLETALEIQKKTLRKLGDILVSNEALSQAKLKEFLALQTKETVYRLFLWRTGEYEFITEERPRYERELATPMSPQHLVMDSFRMMDEWPSIRKQIQALDAVPGRVHDKVDDVVRYEAGSSPAPAADDELDAAFAQWDDFEPGKTHQRQPSTGKQIELTEAQTIVWDLINGDRTIQQIVDRSLLGEFNTAKQVASLIETGAVRILGRRKPDTKSVRISALPTNTRERLVKTVFGIVASLGILVLALGAVVVVQIGGGNPVVSQQHGVAPARTIDGALTEVATQRKRKAEDVYWLVEGTYPETPEDLARLGLE